MKMSSLHLSLSITTILTLYFSLIFATKSVYKEKQQIETNDHMEPINSMFVTNYPLLAPSKQRWDKFNNVPSYLPSVDPISSPTMIPTYMPSCLAIKSQVPWIIIQIDKQSESSDESSSVERKY